MLASEQLTYLMVSKASVNYIEQGNETQNAERENESAVFVYQTTSEKSLAMGFVNILSNELKESKKFSSRIPRFISLQHACRRFYEVCSV